MHIVISALIVGLLGNVYIQAALVGWASAQTIKVLLTLLLTHKFDYTRALGSGGMPSSHSAMVMALLTVIFLREGADSSVFALAFCFSVVVMYDAAGVRRSTGKNAAVLNHLLEDMEGLGIDTPDERLKELVGHTPIQVLAGAALGIVVGAIMA